MFWSKSWYRLEMIILWKCSPFVLELKTIIFVFVDVELSNIVTRSPLLRLDFPRFAEPLSPVMTSNSITSTLLIKWHQKTHCIISSNDFICLHFPVSPIFSYFPPTSPIPSNILPNSPILRFPLTQLRFWLPRLLIFILLLVYTRVDERQYWMYSFINTVIS